MSSYAKELAARISMLHESASRISDAGASAWSLFLMLPTSCTGVERVYLVLSDLTV